MELSGSGTEVSDPSALLSQPKPTALFVYLLLDRPGALQRRDKLAAMLWPESDQKRARGALSQTLYVIRRHLGADVLTTRGTEDVGIAAEEIRCDALDFQRLLSEGRREEALALYGGDLLPSFYLSDTPAFEHWLATEQAKVRRAARDAAWVLADTAESEGDVAGAGRWSRWAARIDPHDEAALRRMMEMLHRLDDRSGALAEFDRYRKRLLAEAEFEPESETSQLAARIASAGKRGEGPVVPARPRRATAGLGDGAGTRGLRPQHRTTSRRIGSAVVAIGLLVAAMAVLKRVFMTPSPEPASGAEVRNPVADSLYRSALQLMSNSYNAVALQRAVDNLRDAIEADPGFPSAYVALAGALLQQSRLYWEVDPREQGTEALKLLIEAKNLAPDLPSTYTALGWYYYGFDRDYQKALRSHETAIHLAPQQALAYNGYAFPLIATGQVDSALAVVRTSRELDPMDPMVVSTECWIQYLANHLEDALRTCTFVTDSIDSAYEVALDIKNLVSTLLMVQDGDTAGLARKRRAFEADPSSIGEQNLNFEHGVAFYWATVGDTVRALATLQDEKTMPNVRPLRIAIGYATIGQMDTAFAWLDRAIELRDPLVPEITVRPVMVPFRKDPRFPEVLRMIGLDRYFTDTRR